MQNARLRAVSVSRKGPGRPHLRLTMPVQLRVLCARTSRMERDTMFPTESFVAEPVTPSAAHFSLLEIKAPHGFIPRNERHMPPLMGCWLSHKRARDLAIALNRDTIDGGGRGPWHLLVVCGKTHYGVLRIACRGKLPTDPRALPAELADSISGAAGMKTDIRRATDTANRSLLRISREPCVWYVPIRAMTDTTPDEEQHRREPVPGTAGRPHQPGPVSVYCQDVAGGDGQPFTVSPKG